MSDNDSSVENNPYTAPLSSMVDERAAKLATRLERFLAALIDVIIQIVAAVIVALVFGRWLKPGSADADFFAPDPVDTVLGFVTFVVINGYFLACDSQTIGKKAMSIKIVRTDGSKAGLARILLRREGPIWLCQLIPYVGLLLGLADVLCILRASRRCLHDDIAGTKVVKD